MSAASAVMLVFEEAAGVDVQEFMRLGHCWVVDTPSNRKLVRGVQISAGDGGDDDPLGPGATMFTPMGSTQDDRFFNLLEVVVDHHPELSRLSVIGIGATDRIRQIVASYGLRITRESSNNFTAEL